MSASRAVVCAALLTIAGLTVAGCGDNGRSGDIRGGIPSTSPSPSSAQNAPSSPAAGQATPQPSDMSGRTDSSPRQEERMNIQITIGDQHLGATIFDSAAGRDLIAQLPLTPLCQTSARQGTNESF